MLLDKLAFTENKYEELSVKISDPSIMANQKEWRKLCKEHADLDIIVTAKKKNKKVVEDLAANREMLEEETDKEMKEMQEAIKVGDMVVTNSGMYGKVVDVVNNLFVLEFGLNKGIRIPIEKNAVVGVKEPNLSTVKQEEVEEVEEVIEEKK